MQPGKEEEKREEKEKERRRRRKRRRRRRRRGRRRRELGTSLPSPPYSPGHPSSVAVAAVTAAPPPAKGIAGDHLHILTPLSTHLRPRNTTRTSASMSGSPTPPLQNVAGARHRRRRSYTREAENRPNRHAASNRRWRSPSSEPPIRISAISSATARAAGTTTPTSASSSNDIASPSRRLLADCKTHRSPPPPRRSPRRAAEKLD